MADPALHTAAIAGLELADNRALQLDRAAADRLGELEGEVFRLQCTQPAVDFYLLPEAGRVSLRGFHDGEVTTAIRGTALDLDWEAPLVDTLGDVAGHQLAEGLRGLFGWGRQAGESIRRQLEEFIHEEARLAPPRQEVEDFYDDVEKLNQRVERLAARASRLAARVGANTEKAG